MPLPKFTKCSGPQAVTSSLSRSHLGHSRASTSKPRWMVHWTLFHSSHWVSIDHAYVWMSIILPIKLLFYYFDVLGGFGVANSFALGHQAQFQGVMVVRAWLTLNHDMLHQPETHCLVGGLQLPWGKKTTSTCSTLVQINIYIYIIYIYILYTYYICMYKYIYICD